MKTTRWRVVVAACVLLPIGVAVDAQTPASPSRTATTVAAGNAQAGKDLYCALPKDIPLLTQMLNEK